MLQMKKLGYMGVSLLAIAGVAIAAMPASAKGNGKGKGQFKVREEQTVGARKFNKNNKKDLADMLAIVSARGGNGGGNGGGGNGGGGGTPPPPPPPPATGTQVVYLQFDATRPTFTVDGVDGVTFNAHFYTPSERAVIQANMESEYAGFDYSFTQSEPTSGTFSTLTFECSLAQSPCISVGDGGILFGQADGIDVGNLDRGDNAFVDANLWEFLLQAQALGLGFVPPSEFVIGIPFSSEEEATSIAIMNQASNTAAHELGHIQGLRHIDAAGAVGDGLPTTIPAANLAAFSPAYPGPVNASESVLHTMASGASVGTGLTDSTSVNRFFSERSSVKLAANTAPNTLTEADIDANGGVFVFVPQQGIVNTIISGINAGNGFTSDAVVIQGNIEGSRKNGEVDTFRFNGVAAGQIITAEIQAFTDSNNSNPTISKIGIQRVNANGSRTLIAESFLTFEGPDGNLFDLVLPTAGDYEIVIQPLSTQELGQRNPNIRGSYRIYAYMIEN